MTTHPTRHDRPTRTALRPLIGGDVVAAWPAGVIVNLLPIPGFADVALLQEAVS